MFSCEYAFVLFRKIKNNLFVFNLTSNRSFSPHIPCFNQYSNEHVAITWWDGSVTRECGGVWWGVGLLVVLLVLLVVVVVIVVAVLVIVIEVF